ncbi:MAG TPA: hypothetical protein ENK19_05915, partial [Acidobacteria bacterium]|nr:hypothetical protein [Acidobacteriota bacterium]
MACLLVAAGAQTRELHWDRISVKLELTRDGDLRVEEQLGYVFNGAWNGGYRNLPLEWVEGYDDISVSQDGFGPYHR